MFDRTARVLDSDAAPPRRIVVLDDDESRDGGLAGASEPPFFRLFGLEAPETDGGEPGVAAYVAEPTTVYVNGRLTADPRLERVLAHEYVHVVQFRTGAVRSVRDAVDRTFDGRLASRATIEGAAVFGADTYWDTYLGNGTSPAADSLALYEGTTGAGRLSAAPYRFGYLHAAARVDDPANLSALYRDPPTTSEQLLHPNVTEGPARLSVRAAEDEWYASVSRQRYGEVFVRVALRAGVNRSAAARAAAGWGSDARIDFVNPARERGYAWVLRFDDAANATEFRAVAEAWLSERAEYDDATGTWVGEDGEYRLARADDRTVVWLAGDDDFVANASVAVTNGEVGVKA
ncbi:hypothetical protein [Halosegnis marinus]|uniref:hypothetical protein n=1 Tax=Halosegnis marinus TaxID=3034023 RepID=UPI003620A4AD